MSESEKHREQECSSIRFDFSEKSFFDAPPIQRGLFVVAQAVVRDVAKFRNCYHFSLNYEEAPPPMTEFLRAAQIHQALYFGRVLASVVYEALLVLEQIFGEKRDARFAPIEVALRRRMDQSEIESLEWCLDALSATRRWLPRLRNEVTFHYGVQDAVDAWGRKGPRGSMMSQMFFASDMHNCFFPLADEQSHRIITEAFHLEYPNDVPRAAQRFGAFIHDASEHVANVFGFVIMDFAVEHLGFPRNPKRDDLPHQSLREIAPAYGDVSLPAFVQWTAVDQGRWESDKRDVSKEP